MGVLVKVCAHGSLGAKAKSWQERGEPRADPWACGRLPSTGMELYPLWYYSRPTAQAMGWNGLSQRETLWAVLMKGR